MLLHRSAAARGQTRTDWLQSWHSFSFAAYHDPQFMGFRHLRVINEDIVAPGAGFAEHGHANMEILTYLLSGALAHKDSTGSTATIRPGDVQLMTAGRGIRHSEFNASDSEPVHLLQIWIKPARHGLPPEYREKHFAPADRHNRLCLIASPDGAEDSVRIHQQVRIFASQLAAGQSVQFSPAPDEALWLHLATGGLEVNGQNLAPGDGLAATQESAVTIHAARASEFLLFALA